MTYKLWFVYVWDVCTYTHNTDMYLISSWKCSFCNMKTVYWNYLLYHVIHSYKNTEHSSLAGGIWGWSKSSWNKISKIEWDRIDLTSFFFFPQGRKSLTTGFLARPLLKPQILQLSNESAAFTTLEIKAFYHDIFHKCFSPSRVPHKC